MNVRTKILLGTAVPGLLLLLVYNFVHRRGGDLDQGPRPVDGIAAGLSVALQMRGEVLARPR